MQNFNAQDVDAYIATAPEEVQKELSKLRAVIQALAPKAEEIISYKIPGYKLYGKPLIYFAYFKNHISFFAASGTFLKSYEKELQSYKVSKGTIQFPLGKPLPMSLVKKLVKARIKQVEELVKLKNEKVKNM